MQNKKIIFIHGYTSSSKVDFYPKLSKLLDKEGISYSIRDLPGGEHPKAKEWLKIINEEVSKSDKPIILVGHSLGTRAALLFLDQFNIHVDGVILIAAFNNNCEENRFCENEYYEDFWKHSVNIEKIKKQSNKFIVMHSEDDSSIDYRQGKEIAKELDATLFTYKDRDHFCEPKNAEEIFKVIKSLGL